MPPSPDLYRGDVEFERAGDHDLRVLRADSRIRIADKVLRHIRAGVDPWDRAHLDGDILHITADNGTWIYRLVGYDERTASHLAEWVD